MRPVETTRARARDVKPIALRRVGRYSPREMMAAPGEPGLASGPSGTTRWARGGKGRPPKPISWVQVIETIHQALAAPVKLATFHTNRSARDSSAVSALPVIDVAIAFDEALAMHRRAWILVGTGADSRDAWAEVRGRTSWSEIASAVHDPELRTPRTRSRDSREEKPLRRWSAIPRRLMWEHLGPDHLHRPDDIGRVAARQELSRPDGDSFCFRRRGQVGSPQASARRPTPEETGLCG